MESETRDYDNSYEGVEFGENGNNLNFCSVCGTLITFQNYQ